MALSEALVVADRSGHQQPAILRSSGGVGRRSWNGARAVTEGLLLAFHSKFGSFLAENQANIVLLFS